MNTTGRNNKRAIIIDSDPGIDDAIALAFALFSNELDIKLLTTVNGNVSLEKVTKNMLQLLNFFGKEVPVAKGAATPLLRKAVDASDIHGSTGMDGYQFEGEAIHLLLKEHAVNAMHRTLKEAKGQITLVAIGPLTNIALLFKMYPDDKKKVDELILMGGNITRGNLGVLSEFNIGVDPEAAKIVFESGVPLVVAPLEVGNKTKILPEDSENIKQKNKTGDMMYQLFKKYRSGSFATGLAMYDSCAIGYLLNPDMYQIVNSFVGVEVYGEYTTGATVIDLEDYLGKRANAKVLIDVNVTKFKEWFLATIDTCI